MFISNTILWIILFIITSKTMNLYFLNLKHYTIYMCDILVYYTHKKNPINNNHILRTTLKCITIVHLTNGVILVCHKHPKY